MKDFSKFLVEHLDIIVSAILLIITTIVALIQKRPVTNKEDHVFKQLMLRLPGFIMDAEKSGAQGENKMKLVIDDAIEFVSGEIKLNDDDLFSWSENIRYLVELILSTPRKKK